MVDNDKVYLKGFRGQLGLSPVLVLNSSCLLRTMGWYQWLSQFRKDVPLFLIHDFGHILRSEPNEDFHISFRKKALARLSEFLNPKEKSHIINALEDYRALLQRISETELATVLRKQKASEVFTAGLLAHLFQGLFFEGASMSPLPSAKVNDQVLKELDRFQYLSATQINQFAQTLLYIVRQKKQLLIAVEQVDCESLKLLQLTTTQSNTNNYFLELLQMFSMASAQDVARFSLDLLPSVLETKKSRGTQTYAVDGYASIDNRGPISSLLPTELVYDDDIFDKRYLHKEQFFYAREKDHELKDRLHYFMVDASASMRGLRSMFARGVALAMAKKHCWG